MSTTIRVSHATRKRLAALASESDQTMTSVVDDAVAALERQRFFNAFNARYESLRADQDEWSRIEQERTLEANSLADDA